MHPDVSEQPLVVASKSNAKSRFMHSVAKHGAEAGARTCEDTQSVLQEAKHLRLARDFSTGVLINNDDLRECRLLVCNRDDRQHSVLVPRLDREGHFHRNTCEAGIQIDLETVIAC